MTTVVGSRRWRRIGLALLVVLALTAVAAWIASILLRPHFPTQAEVVTEMRAQAALTGGERVFAVHCAACHAHGFAPWLGGRDLNGEAIRAFVRMGPSGMPAFPPSQVSDADIDAVADYLNGLPVSPDPKT